MLVFYVLAMMVMFGFVALVVDVGYLYTQKAQQQLLADTIVVTTLATTGFVAGEPPQTTQEQIDYINDFIDDYQNPANDLPSSHWQQRIPESDGNGNVTTLTLNEPLVLDTFFMNLFGLKTVTVGIHAVAVRNCLGVDTGQDPGPLGFFGCLEVNWQGNPTWRSKNYETMVIGDNAFGGSNVYVKDQGSVYFGGEVFSAETIEFIGGGNEFNGTYRAPNIINQAGGGTWTQIVEPVPPITVPPAVGNATAADNDNIAAVGAHDDFRNGIDFDLRKAGNGPGTITIPAGSRIYAHSIDLKQTTLEITGNPEPDQDGPVWFNIDPQGPKPNVNNERWFSDRDFAFDVPAKPKYVQIIGLNQTPCSANCDKQNKDVPKLVFSHHTAYVHVYAPGFQLHIDSNPTWHGAMVVDCIHTQGTPDVFIDEEGFNYEKKLKPNDCVYTRTHLIQ